MRRIAPVFLLLILLASCKGKNHVPSDVIPMEKMRYVLWDMMRVDQFVTDYMMNRDTTYIRAEKSQPLYQQVFSIHQITKEKFERSFNYYKNHPALLGQMMDSLVTMNLDSTVQKSKGTGNHSDTVPVQVIKPVPDTPRKGPLDRGNKVTPAFQK